MWSLRSMALLTVQNLIISACVGVRTHTGQIKYDIPMPKYVADELYLNVRNDFDKWFGDRRALGC